MSLSFNEAVDVASINYTGLQLHSWFQPIDSFTQINITAGTSISPDGPTINITISNEDLTAIKANTRLCTILNSCWARVTSSFIQDTNGQAIEELLTNSVFVEDEYSQILLPDITSPRVSSYNLSMDTGGILISFDEPVNPQTLVREALTIQSSANSAIQYTLTGGTIVGAAYTTLLQFVISPQDLIEIKAIDNLASNRDNTFITYSEEFIDDTFQIDPNSVTGNPVQPRFNGEGLQVLFYAGDLSDPNLVEFTQFDLNTGSLLLSFDEPVNISSFDSSKISLQSEVSSGDNHTLISTFVEFSLLSSNKLIISITFGAEDEREIKLLPNLATSTSNTFLYAFRGFINDVAGNAVNLIEQMNSTQVVQFLPDTTPPRLTDFDFDLNEGLLTLTFNDIMDVASLNPTRITIQANASSANQYSFTSGTVSLDNGFVVNLTLSAFDLNRVKATRELADTFETTFLTVTSDSITDVSGVEVISISSGNGRQVKKFTPDRLAPTLLNFTFSFESSFLELSFSETVDPLNFIPGSVTLQSVRNITAVNGTTFSLSSDSIPESDIPSNILSVRLTEDDLNIIKSLRDLGTNQSNTFLSIKSDAIRDMSSLFVIEIPPTEAIQAASFVIDDRSPSLAAFVLDLNTNTLILTFSETISVSSLDLNKIFLRSGQNTFSEEYVFTGGDKPSLDSPIVNVLLTLDDSNAIRANRILAIDESSTFLQISTDAFQDAAGNIGTPLGISQAIQGSFIADVTGPTIDSYVLDLSLNTLILNFSETVDPLTFNPLLFTFQSSRANSISSRTLTGGALTSPNPSPILTLNLLSPDIVTLKTYRICYKRFS